MTIDDRTRAALARLTDSEKRSLRARLDGATAKQIALAHGVSPHAIEKRLKMARAKLGVSSSLEVARLLAASEASVRLVPHAPALPPSGRAHQVEQAPPPGTRKEIMPMLLLALSAALLPQASVPSDSRGQTAVPVDPAAYRAATPAEVRAYVAASFRGLDKDRSGYVERSEAPMIDLLDPAQQPSVTEVRGRPGQALWIGMLDTDGDGRVSEAEFDAERVPFATEHGVPVDWRPAAATPR